MKDLLLRESSYTEEEYLIQQINILKDAYMKQIQPHVDRLVQIKTHSTPERIFILDGFNPELFNKEIKLWQQ